jgi:hypothetical protein
MFPDDATLLARGKYSTLSHERHEQIRRVVDICRMMQATIPQVLSDCQEEPPVEIAHIPLLEKCVANLTSARERIMTMCLGMAELKPDAWPK